MPERIFIPRNGSSNSRTIPAVKSEPLMPWRQQHEPKDNSFVQMDVGRGKTQVRGTGPFRTLEHICSRCRDDRHVCHEVSSAKDENSLITAVLFGWDELEDTDPSWQYFKLLDQSLFSRKDGATRLSMIVHRWLSKVTRLENQVHLRLTDLKTSISRFHTTSSSPTKDMYPHGCCHGKEEMQIV